MNPLLRAFQAILKTAGDDGLIVDGKINKGATVEQWLDFVSKAIDIMVDNELTLEDIKSILGIASMVLNLR